MEGMYNKDKMKEGYENKKEGDGGKKNTNKSNEGLEEGL
jgi:hypothetical protein